LSALHIDSQDSLQVVVVFVDVDSFQIESL
jgi:hypothetical protein